MTQNKSDLEKEIEKVSKQLGIPLLEKYWTTPGIGNCWYEAISSLMRLHNIREISAKQLREEVIDNLVQIKGIKYLYHLKRIKDNEVWDFESDLEPLREIRKLVMDSDGQVGLELKVVQDDEKDNSELH